MSESLREFQRVWLKLAERGEVDGIGQQGLHEIHQEYMTQLNNLNKLTRLWKGISKPQRIRECLDALSAGVEDLEKRMDELVAEHAPEPVWEWREVAFEDIVDKDRIRLVSPQVGAGKEREVVVIRHGSEMALVELNSSVRPFQRQHLPIGWKIERYVEA